MSILFRTKGWLTIAQLARAWTAEIQGAERDPQQFEQELVHLLLEDIVNKRLDDAGPLAEGRRLGLRIITPDHRAGFLDGDQARDLLLPGGAWTLHLTISRTDMRCHLRHGGAMLLLPQPSPQTVCRPIPLFKYQALLQRTRPV